jgi:YD repeat-containing protein
VTAEAGGTSGSYVQMLDNNAQYLGRLGESVTDVGQLWSLAILQADGLVPIEHLSTATDLAVAAPGPQLTFGRMYHESLTKRYALSTLGRGWSVARQESLAVQPDGTVVITSDGGDQARYQPDSRHPGSYFSVAGDSSTLTAGPGGSYTLTDEGGTVTSFRADGKLAYVQDTNGNTITAGYNAAGQLTRLTHSSGASLTLAYNAAGLIASVKDSVGRKATYTYDSSNQYLLSVQTPAGTTHYGYSSGSGEAVHSLTTISFPDGTHLYYAYDSFGRLASTSRDGDTERVTLGYDEPGEVTITDADGGSNKIFYDNRGLVAKIQDALGNVTTADYDPATLQVNKITDATGQSQSFTYSADGNLTSSTDALGHKTLFTYGDFSRLTSLTDANGNKTTYAYDPAGNLLSTTYANGSVEGMTFDPLGDPLSFTNRRGQAIGYTFNAAGQMTRLTFPDATHADYTYDSHGNLKTATDAGGTITFTYMKMPHAPSTTLDDVLQSL